MIALKNFLVLAQLIRLAPRFYLDLPAFPAFHPVASIVGLSLAHFPRFLDAGAMLYKTHRELDRRVKQAATHDSTCLRFMAIRGVGPIAALTFRLAIDDPSRCTSSRTVAAHFGLKPGRFQSGKSDNHGRASKAGDSHVRATLYAAANAMMMISVASSEIKSWGLRLMRRKVRRRAIVAVARILPSLCIAWGISCFGLFVGMASNHVAGSLSLF